MMISSESFYDLNLKGKTENEIKSVIHGLKVRIGLLKKTIEQNFYNSEPNLHPSPETVLHWYEEY